MFQLPNRSLSRLAPSRGVPLSWIKGHGNSGCIKAFAMVQTIVRGFPHVNSGRLERCGHRNSELTENPTLRASRSSTLGLRIQAPQSGPPFVARTSEPFLGGDREYPQEPEIMDMMAPYEKDEREEIMNARRYLSGVAAALLVF